MSGWRNWSGLVESSPDRCEVPDSLEQLREVVAAAQNLRVAGSGHSFTALVPCDDVIVSLERLGGVVATDEPARRAVCKAGTRICDLGEPLFDGGLSLSNQGDIDRQALAGALATATHGTGVDLGCIASRVTGFTVINASGDVVRASANESTELFEAGRVGLGALGVVVDVEMACEPSYFLRERTWSEPTEALLDQWEELATEHRHFEFFAFPYTGSASVKTLDALPVPPEWKPASTDESTAESTVDSTDEDDGFRRLLDLNLDDPVEARDRLRRGLERAVETERSGPAFRIFPSERNNRFNEMEYAIPREEGATCLREILRAIERANVPVLFPIEFRTVAADDCWLSPFYGRDAVTLSIHQDARQDHSAVFDLAEPILIRRGGRPHWGKIHSLRSSELEALYPKFRDFIELRRSVDPSGKFVNGHLRALFD